MQLELHLPTTWSELTDDQIEFVFRLIARELTAPEIKTLCLIRWNHIKVIGRTKKGWWIKHKGKLMIVSTRLLQTATSVMDYIEHVPATPVRLSKIGKHKPLEATFEGVPFETYLYAENLYQGFLHTEDMGLLEELVQILYGSTKVKAEKHHCLMCFYWFASLKILLANEFKNFYQPMGEVTDSNLFQSKNLYQKLRDAMNGQIRALTSGDISKEKEVLAMDTWRALTELDAKAYEFEQMKKTK